VNLKVEFDHGGRSYAVESASIQVWNVYSIAQLNDQMTIETDLRSGDEIFVTWSQVGVIRLASPVDGDGYVRE
jgi:hypothetical protein